MLEFLKRLFKPKEPEIKRITEDKHAENLLNKCKESNDSCAVDMNWDIIEDPIIRDISKSKPSLLLMDDIADTLTMYDIDFVNIKKLFHNDIYNDFNIISCRGDYAGFIAQKFIDRDLIKIDYAILDITLGKIIKLRNAEFIEIDGIDIAISILKQNPDAKILFSTGHDVSERNPSMNQYFTKWYEATGKDLKDCFVKKENVRYTVFNTFLYGNK